MVTVPEGFLSAAQEILSTPISDEEPTRQALEPDSQADET
jgi:hypothetical protein